MAETLEAITCSLFKNWFIDFAPVHAKVERRQTDLPDDLATLFPDRFGDGGLPVGWTESRLADQFSLTMGQSPPGSTYNERGEGLPFYQGRTDFGFRYPNRRVFCSEPTRVAEP